MAFAPLQLVTYDAPTRKFRVVPETVQVLQDAFAGDTDPTGFVSIVGPLRAGKSFFMNALGHYPVTPFGRGAAQPSQFIVGSTQNAVTKGIWVWAKKSAGKTIVLLDTEGLLDPRNPDPRYDAQVFLLATLLSSTLVYHLPALIDSSVLSSLAFIAEAVKRVRIGAGDDPTKKGLTVVAPQLFFVLKNHALDLVHPVTRQPLSEQGYLECALSLNDDDLCTDGAGFPPAVVAKMNIAQSFPRRKLRILPPPGCAPEQLSFLPEDQIKESFRSKLQAVALEVLSGAANVGVAGGVRLNVAQYLALVTKTVDAINDGGDLRVDTVMRATIDLANSEALKAAADAFQAVVAATALPVGDVELTRAQASAMASAAAALRGRAMVSGPQDLDSLNKELAERAVSLVEAFGRANAAAAARLIEPLAAEVNAAIRLLAEDATFRAPGGATKFAAAAQPHVARLDALADRVPCHMLMSAIDTVKTVSIDRFEALIEHEVDAKEKERAAARAAAAKAEAAAALKQQHEMERLATEAQIQAARERHDECVQRMRLDQAQSHKDAEERLASVRAEAQRQHEVAKREQADKMASIMDLARRRAAAQETAMQQQQQQLVDMMKTQDLALARQREASAAQMQQMFGAVMQMQQSEAQAAAEMARAQAQVAAANASKPSFGEQLLGTAVSVVGGVATKGLSTLFGF